jgi:hypothetical protein
MAHEKCVSHVSAAVWLQLILALFLLMPLSGQSLSDASHLATLFQQQVDGRLTVPAAEQRQYATLLAQALAEAGFDHIPAQYVVLVDRNVLVQAAMIFWRSDSGEFQFIGASQASSGQPGRFEHFETPLGVFPHSLDNPDFRAEGTRNEFGILGYGRKGLRVYDFGWVEAPRGWGDGHQSIMRLQLHSTDPGLLEPRLGSVQSKGCIRISASLNRFIDHYGILDAQYERALGAGQSFWVLSPDREPTPWSGQFLVVVDTQRNRRPEWSPKPHS